MKFLKFYNEHHQILKRSGMVLFATGVGLIITQIKRTYNNLNNVLDVDVINFIDSINALDSSPNSYNKYIVIDLLKTYDSENLSVTQRSWKALKYTFARRLLHLANSGNASMRRKALQQMANIKDLEKWHYSLLTNVITAKTAVGLARTPNVDLNLFLKPNLHAKKYSNDMILNYMKDFLITLNEKSNHSCFAYFISKAILNEDNERFIDNDSVLSELRKLIKAANNIMPLCLESLLHHSSVKHYAKDIVTYNGLNVLMEVYNQLGDDMDINITICSILANISTFPELLEDIHKSGWIGILAQWVKDPDIRIAATAAKTLANLDPDEDFNALYSRSVYVLHPLSHSVEKPKIDVIFIHGLLGGVFYTWRQRNLNDVTVGFLESFSSENNAKFLKSSDPVMREYMEDLREQEEIEWDKIGQDFEFVLNDIPVNANDKATGPYSFAGCAQCVKPTDNVYSYCWPTDWLVGDYNNVRVLGVNYDTTISLWTPMCPELRMKSTLDERSKELIKNLENAGVGKRPIVWVTHSMGGLLVKDMLCKAVQSDSEAVRNICSNTKGIVFFSTPHLGSILAKLSPATSYLLWPSVEVQELREESPYLLNLHKRFLEVLKENPMKIISFVETKTTLLTSMKFNIVFVKPHSANPSVGEVFEIPLDHLGICKPQNRQSFLYQRILNIIKEIAQESEGLSRKSTK